MATRCLKLLRGTLRGIGSEATAWEPRISCYFMRIEGQVTEVLPKWSDPGDGVLHLNSNESSKSAASSLEMVEWPLGWRSRACGWKSSWVPGEQPERLSACHTALSRKPSAFEPRLFNRGSGGC